ncbi:MAG: hypothetical protein ACXQTZ_01710 [Candidatus Alkanophagales archaeon]
MGGVKLSELMPIDEMKGGWYMNEQLKRMMVEGAEILWGIRKDRAEELARLAGGELVDAALDDATEWCIMFRPLPYLRIFFFLQLYEPEFENELRVLYGREVADEDIPVEDVFDFTRFMRNALVRAARRLLGVEGGEAGRERKPEGRKKKITLKLKREQAR